jgi:hypothetical protein
MSDTTPAWPKNFTNVELGTDGRIHVLADYDDLYAEFGSDTIWIYPFTGFNDVALVAISQPVILDTTPIPVFSQWFDIYPNPNSGEFNIGLYENMPLGSHFEIWDTRGKLIQNIEIPQRGLAFRVAEHLFSSGLYFIVLKNDFEQIQQTKKIIIHLP